MQQKNWGYVVSGVSCLLVVIYLSGCAGGAGGAGGFNLGDLRSTLQSVNEQTTTVRDFRNNLQQLMIKLNTLATMSAERLQNVDVVKMTNTLRDLSGNITGAMGGCAVDLAIQQIFLRLPVEVRMYWNPWLGIPILTTAINIQASYLNVAIQYMNKNASTMLPDEVKRISAEITKALTNFNNIGI
jgi:hypothetical protein